MRILFIYDALYPDRTGGVEHRNRALARELSRRGHDVTLAGWARDVPDAPDGAKVLELSHSTELYDEDGRRRPRAALQFARAVTELDAKAWDVVETANIPYVHLFPLWLKTKGSRTSLVVTWHEFMGPAWEGYLSGWKAPIFAGVERMVSSIGDIRVAVSEFTRDRLQDAGDGSGKAVPVVPNGIPLEKMASIRREFGTPFGTGPAIVFAGRLHSNKRIQLVLNALENFELDRPPPWFRIIGDGPRRKGLENSVRESGLSDRVEFTGQLECAEDVWESVAACDIAVQPSSREGFGMFPLEAMGLGLPLVYWDSADSALSNLMRNQRGGIGIQSVEGFQRSISNLLKSPEDYKELRQGALRRAEDFDWEEFAGSFEQLLLRS